METGSRKVQIVKSKKNSNSSSSNKHGSTGGECIPVGSDPHFVPNMRKLSITSTSIRNDGSDLCYRMGDVVMVFLFVFPLGIAFWRGVWQLMDYYSNKWEVDPWLSIGLGYSIPFVLHLFQSPLSRWIHPERTNYIVFYILTRMLLLLHSVGSVNQWRGLWQLLDMYTGLGPVSAIVSLSSGIVLNLLGRTLSNVLAPPLLCGVDEAFTIHDCALRFKTLV